MRINSSIHDVDQISIVNSEIVTMEKSEPRKLKGRQSGAVETACNPYYCPSKSQAYSFCYDYGKVVTISSSYMKELERRSNGRNMRKTSVTPVSTKGEKCDMELNLSQKGRDVGNYLGREGNAPTDNGHTGSGDPRNGCCWRGRIFLDAIKAMTTRLMFLLHALLAIWRVTVVMERGYWLLSIAFLGLIVETLLVLIKRRGHEWRWFQWSVFLYLCAVLPPIWIIELNQLGLWRHNSTILSTDLQNNKVQVPPSPRDALSSVLPVAMKPEEWAVALEQGLLVLIIIGRWLMPKGELTRNQLSALLLVHLGTASDIVDLLTILSEKEVRASPEMSYTVLAVWTWALCQFPFVVTVTKSDKEKDNTAQETTEAEKSAKKGRVVMACGLVRTMIETEAWAICVSVFMQDGPFIIVRLTAIFMYHVVTYTNYFFTAKNGLVLFLQMYRLVSVCLEHNEEKEREEREKEEARRLWENNKKKMWLT